MRAKRGGAGLPLTIQHKRGRVEEVLEERNRFVWQSAVFCAARKLAKPAPAPPRVYTRPTSVQFVRSLDGMDEDRSILRGNAPTRRFLVLIPRDGNRCVPLAHCYGNERSRRYLPILDRPLQIVFLIATRVLFARLPGNVIYQIVGVFIAMKFETRCFQAVTTNLLFPPSSIDAPSQEQNRIPFCDYFFSLSVRTVLKIASRDELDRIPIKP